MNFEVSAMNNHMLQTGVVTNLGQVAIDLAALGYTDCMKYFTPNWLSL
jgi:hypothetical protein